MSNARRYSKSKYGNRKVEYKGMVFDSVKERKRYIELELLEKAGYISDIRRQVKYTLIPSQKDHTGKVIERPCIYIADFVYRDLVANKDVVEDTKGFKTPEYIIKRKMMLYHLGIRVSEV